MRIILTLFVLITAASLNAQTAVPLSFNNTQSIHPFYQNNINDSILNKKWSVNTYGGISTGLIFYKGGHAGFLSAPLGLQLNRRLNNNLYAFAGASVAPSYVNFNNPLMFAGANKINSNNNFLRSNNFNISSTVDLGLMYVNDAKTFSISGSIGVERSSYPVYQFNQVNANRQNPVIYSR